MKKNILRLEMGFLTELCRTSLVILCMLISFNTYAQPSNQLQQLSSINQLNIIVHKGVECYELPVNQSGITLRAILQQYNLNGDTLRAYNRHLGTGSIPLGTKVYYPVHMITTPDLIPRHHSSPLNENERYTFKVLDENNQVKTRIVTLNDFKLKGGERFAAVNYGTELIKSDTLVTKIVDGRRVEFEEWRFPERYFTLLEDGSQAEGEIKLITTRNLEFDNDLQIFSNVYRLFYESSHNSGIPENLHNHMDVWFEAQYACFVPRTMTIAKTNTEYNLIITDKRFDNPINIEIHTPSKETLTFSIEKEPIIKIETKQRNLEGYGIEEISVLVRLLAYTGDDSLKIDIETTKGSVDPSSFYLSNEKSKTFKLRSSGIGTAIVEVKSSEGYDSKEFKFNFPSMFLIFSLIGGLVGSLIKYLMKHKEYNLGITLLSGCLTGVFMTLLWWILGITPFVGLRLPSGVLNEGLVLLVAILGALYWEKAYSSLSKFLFLKKP